MTKHFDAVVQGLPVEKRDEIAKYITSMVLKNERSLAGEYLKHLKYISEQPWLYDGWFVHYIPKLIESLEDFLNDTQGEIT